MSYTDIQHQLMYAKVLAEMTLDAAGMDSSTTTMTLSSGGGATLRASLTNGLVQVIVWNKTDYASPLLAYAGSAAEIMIITSYVSGDSATVARAQDGTTARNFNVAGKTYGVGIVQGESTFEYLSKPPYYETYLSNLILANAAPYQPSSYLCYPVAGGINTTVQTFLADTLYAMPDSEEAGAILRGLKIRKNTGSSLSVRVGVYANTTLNGNAYPGALIGEDVKTNNSEVSPIFTGTDFPITMPYVRQLRWYVVLLASAVSLVPVDATKQFRNYLGWVHHSSTQLGPIMGVTHAYSYAALPDPFPTTSPALIGPGGTSPTVAPFMTKIYQSLV